MDKYTSSSEFDLVKRVHVTNETPLYDLYQGVNSTLRNSLWKWFLGTQDVEWDMNYGTYDSEAEDTYFKMVNGDLSDTYGPAPTKDTPKPTYHKIKLTGVLMPEYDLLVHEAYRYLNDLYPNHYDYNKILTSNEINSMINNAAAIVDYSPNLKFFDLLADSFDLSSESNTDNEALKLKIRDLKSNAYRRKFYGSKLGYKMFGTSILNNISIFPLGTYLPIVATDLVDGKKQTVDASKNTINIRSNLYKNKFKLIDWTGKSRKVITDEDANVYCKFFNLPGFDYQMFLSAKDTSEFNEFDNIEINNYLSSNYFDSIDTIYVNGKTQSIMMATDTVTEKVLSDYESSSIELDYLTISKRAPIIYVNAYTFGKWDEFFRGLTNTEIQAVRSAMGDGYDTFVAGTNSRTLSLGATSSIEFLFRIFNRLNDKEYTASKTKLNNLKVIASPFNSGLLLTEPSNILDIYNNSYNASASFSDGGVLEGYKTPDASIKSNTNVEVGDIICTTDFTKGNDEDLSIVKVSAINLGEIQFTSNPVTSYKMDSILGYSCPEPSKTSLYGALLKSQDGETQVFVQGELELKTKQQTIYTIPSSGIFKITAIPDYLSDELLALIYPTEHASLKAALAEQTELLKIDSRREAAQIQIDAINAELAFLKINKSKLTVDGSYTDSNGDVQSYETYSIFKGCFISKFYKIIGDFTEMKNNDGTYFWHEMVTYYGALIDYIDYGSYSVLPIVSTGFVATNTVNAYLVDVKDETITGQKFQYIDVIDSYMDLSEKLYSLTDKTPGFMTESTRRQLSYYNATGDNTTISKQATFDVEIEGNVVSTDDARVTIAFTSDAALHDMQSLSIGDPVYGAGVQEDTYITDVGDTSVTVNNKLLKDGDVLFTFTCKFNCAGKDLTEEFDYYRKQLNENNLLKLVNPFEHGVWPSTGWPFVSSSFVDGLVDLSMFSIFEPTFYKVMKGVHSSELKYDNNKKSTNYLVPSTIKFNNDLFVETNLTRLIPIENRNGETNNLCNVEFIDYLSDAMGEIARGTDITNCGTQLSMQTDISGYYTQVSSQKYTDPAIKLLFQTFDCENGMDMPCYAQVGNKGNGRLSWFKSADDNVSPMIYGATFYDKQTDGLDATYTDLVANKGAYNKRSIWAAKTDYTEESDDNSLDEMKYVEKPLFEIALGEYDIQYDYFDDSDNSNKNHTIQCNFYRQKFNDIKFIIESTEDDAIKLISNKFENLNIVNEINKSSIIADDSAAASSSYKLGITSVNEAFLNDVVYCGVWEPLVVNDAIAYPEIDASYIKNISTTLYYKIVETGKTLVYNKGNNRLAISDNSLLVLSLNSSGTAFWQPVSFTLGGSNYPSAIMTDTVQAKDSFNTMCKNIALNYFIDSSGSVVINDVDSFKNNFLKTSQDITNLFDTTKCYIYVCLFDGVDSNGQTAYDTTASTIFSAGSYIAVMYDNTNKSLRFFKLNINTRLVASIQFSMPPKMSTTEFKYLTGALTRFSTTNLRSKITNSIAQIQLPKPFLTDGSVDINVIVDGGFISKGYRATSNGASVDTSNIVYFNISSSAIYYDADLEYFYVNSYEYKLSNGTYAKTGTTLEKFYIYFSDPTYFKNTLISYGSYKLEKTQTSGSSTIDYSPVVSQIDGFTSLYDKLSNEDEILQVKEVITRSFYNALYNNVGFDTHTSLTGDIGSVNEDFTELKIVPTADTTSEKITLQSKIKNLWPVNIVDNEKELVFDTETVDGVKTNIVDRKFGLDEEYKSPRLLDVVGNISSDVLNSKSATQTVIENKFFKNNLIALASLNAETPNRLFAYGNETIFSKVLSVLKQNDSIESVISLTNDVDNSRTITMSLASGKFAPTGSYSLPSYIAYNGTTFVAVSDDGFVYYKDNIDSLATLTKEIVLSVSPVKVGAGNAVSPATYGRSNSKIKLIDWDDDEKKWVFTFDLKNGDDIITQFYESSTLQFFNTAYGDSDVVPLPADFDITKYPNSEVINASTNLTLPDGVDEKDWVAYPTNPADASEGAVAKRSFYCSNKATGEKVLIRGKYIFFKTKTKKSDGSLTSDLYWKKATINRDVNITQTWLTQLGDNDARYSNINSSISEMTSLLKTQADSVNSVTSIDADVKSATNAAYNFIKSFALLNYTNFKNALTSGITLSGIYKVLVPDTTTDDNWRLVTGNTLVSFTPTLSTTDANIVAKPFTYMYADYVPVGSVDGIADVQGAYIAYLADVASYILNSAYYQKIISGYIDSIELTTSHLVIKTTFDTVTYFPLSYAYSVSDIEDASNWIVPGTILGDEIHGAVRTTEYIYSVSANGKLVAIGSDDHGNNKKIYNICSVTAASNMKVMAGYWRKKSEIVSMEMADSANASDLATRKSYIPAYANSTDINYPCIIYAKDDKPFQVAQIGTNTSNSEFSLGTAFAGYKVNKVVYDKGEFKAFISTVTGTPYTYYLRASSDDLSTWEWVKPATTDYINQFVSSEIIQFTDEGDIPSSVVFNPSVVNNTGVVSITGNNAFMLSSPQTLLGSDIKVKSVTDTFITLDQSLITQAAGSSNLVILVAFKTKAAIDKQADYIDYSLISECVNSNGNLKVPAVHEVTSYYEADRLYQYRELLSTSDTTEKVLVASKDANGKTIQTVTTRTYTAQINDNAYAYGYPSQAEDDSRTFYDYSEYVDDNNKLAYAIKQLKNNSGNSVILCNDLGEMLVNRETNDMNSKCVSFYDEISGGIDSSTVALYAGQLNYASIGEATKYGAKIKNKVFNNAASKITFKINEMKYSTTDPFILIKTNASTIDAIGNVLYVYDDVSIEKYISDFNLKPIVTNIYDANGNITSSTTVTVADQYENKNGYIYDKINKRYNLSQKINMSASVSVPYIFYSDNVKVSYNPSIKTNTKGVLTLNDTLSGLYMHINGYGGYSTNTDTSYETLPWDIDSDAFLDLELYNSYGEPVYLNDAKGNKVYNNDGTLFIEPNSDYLTISYDDMEYLTREIVASQSINSTTVSTKSNVYKPEDSAFVLVLTNEMAPANRDKITGLIVNAETTKGKAILYKGIEEISSNVTYDIDYGTYTTVNMSIDATGEYVMNYWNDSQENTSEKAIVTINALINGKIVASATVTYLEFLIDSNSSIIDLFPSSSSDESTSNDLLVRGIRYNADGSLADTIIEVTIPEVNSYSFTNFTQVADPVTSTDNDTTYLTFKLRAPLTYTGEDCTVSLEDGTLTDLISFKQLIDSSYAIYATNENFDIIASDTKTKIMFRVYKGKTSVSSKATKITVVSDTGINADSVSLISNDYWEATFTNTKFTKTPVSVTLTLTVNNKTLTKVFAVRSFANGAPIFVFIGNNNIVTEDTSAKFTIKSVVSSEVKIKGLYSPVICKVPKYINFKSLLQNEGQVIESTAKTYKPVNSPIVLSTETSNFILSEKLKTSDDTFNELINDGKAHVLQFNWLTRATITQEPKIMNNSAYYTKLTLSQIEKYTPDRVYFPNDGYPQPAVTLNNVIYNSENNYMYESNYWFNDNQKRVYECDADGKYIVYGLKDSALTKVTFDYKTHFSSTKDLRFNPHQPVYTSCSDWYKSKFYLENNESNPYWQVIKFADTFNVDTRGFDQVVNVYSYEKGTDEMKLISLGDNERFINITNAVTATLNNNELAITKSAEYIDHKNGKLQFILQQPDDIYRTSSQFIKFGIWSSNPFYGNKIFTDNATIIKLRSMLNLSYIVNSTENVSNPLDKDADIVQVSELGIFNSDHRLIAYATFPAIEYHSKTQHISFICYIKDGTCTEL